MPYKVIGHVIHDVSLPPTQKLVLIVLADFYNEDFGKAWPSQDTICAITGLSLRSINRAISELKKKGHIDVWRECSTGQYAHNTYGINHAPQGHMVEKVGAKNDQTTCQKERKPCATVAHYPLRTLNKPLKENSKKITRNSGLPQSVEEFLELPPVLQENYWYHKPEIQRMLRRNGYEDLRSARKA